MTVNKPKDPRVGNWASRWPELFWIAATWLVIFPLGWLRYQIDGRPYSLGTAAFYLGSLATIVLTARFFGKPTDVSGDGESMLRVHSARYRIQFLVSGLAVAGVIWLYFYARREFEGVDVSSMRAERSNISESRSQYFANMFLSPIALASVVFWLRQTVWIKLGSVVVFLLLFWKAALVSGARFELMPIPLLGGIALWYGYTGRFFKYPLKTTLLAFLGIGFVIGINSFYNIYSTKGGGESTVAAYIRSVGASVFELIGVRNVPIVMEELVGSLAEYVFSPLFYFDFYLKENPFPPTMGTHQFSSIFLRLGVEEANTTKQAVDDLYAALGIYHNVWATGLREIIIDFGVKGALVQCAVMGGLLGFSKRLMHNSFAAQNLYLIVAAYHMATPLVSLFKSRLFEFGFYGALMWLVVDILFHRKGNHAKAQRMKS